MKSEGSSYTLEFNWYCDLSSEGGPYNRGDEMDHLAFKVDDVGAAARYHAEKGNPMILGLASFGDWRVAYGESPDGLRLELVKKTPAHDISSGRCGYCNRTRSLHKPEASK